MVEVAGVEPASRTLFLPLHTAITYSIYLLAIVVKSREAQSKFRQWIHLLQHHVTVWCFAHLQDITFFKLNLFQRQFFVQYYVMAVFNIYYVVIMFHSNT